MTERKYGCHVELGAGEEPDSCVIEYGAHDDCVFAIFPGGRKRRTPTTRKYWLPISPPGPSNPETER
jgi:hypothetical protein